ncbi:MAG: ImmA/IrrE family metallo-endopeptidase, partial [Myxococcales bacterium]|nr:ImmA/IrrE family metallo-endopeptidase [Myxococcales bacterium]
MPKGVEPPSDPRVAAWAFEPGQLARARELRALTKTALAVRVGKTPAALSQFESGAARPDPETLARLALALGVPVGFLARLPWTAPADVEACHFRLLRSVSRAQRRQAVRVGEIIQELAALLEPEGVEFPAETLGPLKGPAASDEAIEARAAEVRRAWGLGLGPIPDPIALLEAQGVLVLPLAPACEAVDAFSHWHGGRPVAMLSMAKSPSRAHFDVAHELGHLVLHEDAGAGDAGAEREADAFASAFLLPRESFLRECPTRWSFERFRALKPRWRVSIAALVVRAYRLGRLTTASYRRAFAELNRRGLRVREPDEWTLSRPRVLRRALELVEPDLPLDALAARLALH